MLGSVGSCKSSCKAAGDPPSRFCIHCVLSPQAAREPAVVIHHSKVGRPGALGLSARSCTPGPRGDLARVRAGGRGGRPALHLTPRRVPSVAQGPRSRSYLLDAGAFGHSGNTRPPGGAPVLFSYIPRVLCPLQGGVIRPTPTGDQCVGPARALVWSRGLRTAGFLAPRHGGEGPPARAPTSPASCDSSSVPVPSLH